MKSVFSLFVSLISPLFLVFISTGCFAQPNGEKLYRQNCAQCHGSDLNGGNATSLIDGVWQFGDEDGYINMNIKFGIPHLGMPSYEETLSDSEIRALIQYIRESENKAGATSPSVPEQIETMDYNIDVDIFAEGLEIPWAIDFIDQNTALITERPGRLRIVKNGILQETPVQGTPVVLHEGQGGLLDVAVDPDYSENGWIYLAYSHALDGKNGNRPLAMTRVVRGKIENNTWVKQEMLFEAPHENYRPTRHHYGCRIVFDPWGYLYFSIGERGYGFEAQDVSLVNGKVHRINKDGSIPESNPFLFDKNAATTIYSYGNRNIQGMAIHPETGQLWATEHGPMGGDELNLILPGRNYGWETITYGKNYNGSIITEETHRPGMEQPALYWKPSIAVCGLDFYRGDLFKKWKNKLLVGALKYEEVRLLDIEKNRVMHDQVIFKGYGRVRDVSTGPDGAIYIVLNSPGTVVRLTPEKN